MPAAASQFDLVPRCSLSTRGALLFFGSVCVATFGVAGFATFLALALVELADASRVAGLGLLVLGTTLWIGVLRRRPRHEPGPA